MAVDPTRETVKQMFAEDDGGPVVMLNLLRFAEGGRAAYDEYARALSERYLDRVGAEVIYAGDGLSPLVAEEGQAWDAVLLVRYPSRAAFMAMVHDPDYHEVSRLRTGALAEAVLQPTRPWP